LGENGEVTEFRAALYVRTATKHPQYSTDNQSDKIRDYASKRGIVIIKTYADDGKSGLSIFGRTGFQKLLSDVDSGRADFNLVLVYDISRWGRFLDPGEGAYYEDICKRAGIRAFRSPIVPSNAGITARPPRPSSRPSSGRWLTNTGARCRS
jgi:DNA invertase Pin-like site-specific DNA recombinase